MKTSIEREITNMVDSAYYDETGVVERLQAQITRLTGIVAALTQALVDNEVLIEKHLDNL